ncbi:MAG: hypothetical protein LDL44_11560 [Caenispirillum sp.]|nr:hypothetical protein [Caenispirillum sp.]
MADPERLDIPHDARDPPPRARDSLWILPLAPTVWALHFVASYVTGAVWCAKVAGYGGPLGDARVLVGIYTAAALAIIAVVGIAGWRRHSYGDATAPHDFATAADRHRFLGFATVLLAALSFVATLFVALPAVFTGSCR